MAFKLGTTSGNNARGFAMDREDVYDYEYTLRNSLKLIEESERIAPGDKQLLMGFLHHLKAKRVSTGRLAKYANHLRRLVENLGCAAESASRGDIEGLSIWIQSQGYAPHTVSDYVFALKYFYKFVRYQNTDRETPFPEEVRWLKAAQKANERKEPAFLTPAEAESLVRSAGHVRDKCMLAVAFESGMRPSELLQLNVGSLSFDDKGVKVRIRKGKTGERTIRIIASSSLLARYMETHPFSMNPDSPLWLTDANNHQNMRMSYVAWSRIIKAAARKAGITDKRKMHHYCMRHGAATEMAKFLTDSEMKVRFGWTMASPMTAVYVHLSARDIEPKLEQIYSGKPVEPARPEFVPTVCPKCHERSAPGLDYCGRCGTPLRQAELAKSAIEEQMLRNELQDVRRQIIEIVKTGTYRPSRET
jgi:site-specific recombinase XerD